MRLLRLLLVRIVINPSEPCSFFSCIFDDYEVVTINIWVLNPEFEAKVLKLQHIVHHYLAEPFFVHYNRSHHLEVRVRSGGDTLLDFCFVNRDIAVAEGHQSTILVQDTLVLARLRTCRLSLRSGQVKISDVLVRVELVLLVHETNLMNFRKKCDIVFHEQVVQKHINFRLQEGHKVLRLYELGVKIRVPLDAYLLSKFLDLAQG